MENSTYTGIKPADATQLSNKLNDLLANYQIFYTNVRGFHWDVKGKKFFELHAKFEDMYNDLAEKIDEVAERILMLGKSPVNTFSQYLKMSAVKEVSGITCGKDAMHMVLDTYKIIIEKQRQIISMAEKAADVVTADLLTGYLGEQEKAIWMYVAYLTPKEECGCSMSEKPAAKKPAPKAKKK